MQTTTPAATRTRGAVVVAVLAIPVVILVVRILGSDWLSFSDWASIELRTRDVGTWHTPLVGPYSRYGWNHPGPLLFWLLAPAYHGFGRDASGLLFGAVVINTAALAGIGTVLWRRGRGAALVLGGVLVLALVRSLGAGFVIDPWNPYVIVLPMLALVLLAWAATDGDAWALPVAVAIGSFAVQSHVGAALGVVAPIAVAVVFMWRNVRMLLIALAVGIACWIPAIVQESQPSGGNLSSVVRFWTESHDNVTGWTAGAHIVGEHLTLPAPWLTGNSHATFANGGVDPHWHIPWALLFLVGATVVAAWKRNRQALALDAIALAFIGAGWISASRVVDTPFDYVVQWLWLAGPLAWFAVAWTAWRAFAASRSWAPYPLRIAAAIAVVVFAFVAVDAVRTNFPLAYDERALTAIAPEARAALAGLPVPVLVESAPDLHSGTIATGLIALAVDAGVDARAARFLEHAVGAWHTIAPEDAGSRVVVAVDDARDPYRNDPRYTRIADRAGITVYRRR